MGTQKLIGHIQHQCTRTFALTGESASLRNEIVLETVHQYYIGGFIKQFLTLVVGDFAHRRKAVDVMRSLLFNRVLRLHIQLLCHLIAVISKQIVI